MRDWGYFEVTLTQAMRLKGVDRKQLAARAGLQYGQLALYLENRVQRPDLAVLARLCTVLNCDVGSLLRHVPPAEAEPLRQTERTYSTGQLAREVAVHPNTVRFYERVGWIAPAERLPNGYRRFNGRHLAHLRVLRTILDLPYTSDTLRRAAFSVSDALKEWDLEAALRCAEAYSALVEREYAAALETAALLKFWIEKKSAPGTGRTYTHTETAAQLGVTPEVLRNWERNGLLCVPRRPPNATRVYGDAELARLRVIYMLRQNHYSIASIYRSLLRYDSGDGAGALLALHQPGEDEELPYVSAGDHWLETLAEAAAGAEKIRRMVWELRAQPSN